LTDQTVISPQENPLGDAKQALLRAHLFFFLYAIIDDGIVLTYFDW
jgi:hypothetical protein